MQLRTYMRSFQYKSSCLCCLCCKFLLHKQTLMHSNYLWQVLGCISFFGPADSFWHLKKSFLWNDELMIVLPVFSEEVILQEVLQWLDFSTISTPMIENTPIALFSCTTNPFNIGSYQGLFQQMISINNWKVYFTHQ